MSEQAWKPIETAPKDASEVLVTDGQYIWLARWRDGKGTGIYGSGWDAGDTDSYGDTIFIYGTLTHWQPLPPLPEQP